MNQSMPVFDLSLVEIQSHFSQPVQSLILSFFDNLASLPDCSWSDMSSAVEQTEEFSIHVERKIARCQALGLWLTAERSQSLTSHSPYGNAAWNMAATFSRSPGGRDPIVKIEWAGEAKYSRAGAGSLSRATSEMTARAFDPQGFPAQMSPEHWEQAIELLNLPETFTRAIAALRESSANLLYRLATQLAEARSEDSPAAG